MVLHDLRIDVLYIQYFFYWTASEHRITGECVFVARSVLYTYNHNSDVTELISTAARWVFKPLLVSEKTGKK